MHHPFATALTLPAVDYGGWPPNATAAAAAAAYDLYDANATYAYVYDDSYYSTSGVFNDTRPTNSR